MISFVRFLSSFLLILFILIYSSDFFNKINFYEDNRQYSFSHMYRTMFVACIDTCTHTNIARVTQNFNFWQITKNFKNSKHHADTLFFHNFHGNIQHISTPLFNKKGKFKFHLHFSIISLDPKTKKKKSTTYFSKLILNSNGNINIYHSV